ncbi:MAG: gliding-motility protein MglA [Myxococcales bacterium]|nr:gliding-motility protein MglA [Myxococcales bacterium]
MPFINLMAREINCKIVYYGPGLCGKTTNLEFIHGHTKAESRGKLVKLATDSERTLYFDFLPFELGDVNGFKTRLHLYTVPGQVYYDASRKLILKGIDGCVFVADSQLARADSNEEALENLKLNLLEYDLKLADIPYVIQYNKRDLPSALSVEELRGVLNPYLVPEFEAVAHEGTGVFETLRAIGRLVFRDLKKSYGAQAALGANPQRAR